MTSTGDWTVVSRSVEEQEYVMTGGCCVPVSERERESVCVSVKIYHRIELAYYSRDYSRTKFKQGCLMIFIRF